MKTQKFLPIVTAFTLGFAGLVLLTPQFPHKSTTYKKDKISPQISSSASFGDFDFTEYTQNGLGKKYTIQGKRFGAGMRRFGIFCVAAARTTEIKDAKVIFFDNNAPVSTIMAERAVMDIPAITAGSGPSSCGSMDFYGDVSIVTADRRTLDCDRLRWDKTNDRILASGKCVLRRGGEAVRSDSVDSDVRLANFVARNYKDRRLKAFGRRLI